MKTFLRKLPPAVEFLLVVAVAFGPLVAISLLSLGSPPAGEASDLQVVLLVAFELGALAVTLLFLRARSFPLDALAPRITLRDTLAGAALFAAALACYLGLYTLLGAIDGVAAPETSRLPHMRGSPAVALLVVVNPVFEETLANAYVITFLKSYGVVAVAASTLLRLSYHLYQGWIALPSLVAYGVVLGGFYYSRGRLWPPIVAHALADLVAVLSL